MDILIRAQWRLVNRSFWLWTLLSLCLTLLFHSKISESGSSSVGESSSIDSISGWSGT